MTTPAKNIQRCLNCISVQVPVYNNCGSQAWPKINMGVPYLNTGNNVSGFTQIGTDYGFTGALSSDGTTINSDSDYQGSVLIPVMVTGDFTFTMEFLPILALSKEIQVYFFDKNTQRAVFNVANDNRLQIAKACDYFQGTGLEDLNNLPGGVLSGTIWNTITLSRSGSVLTLEVQPANISIDYDFDVIFGGAIGFAWFGDTNFKFRNITVTTP